MTFVGQVYENKLNLTALNYVANSTVRPQTSVAVTMAVPLVDNDHLSACTGSRPGCAGQLSPSYFCAVWGSLGMPH